MDKVLEQVLIFVLKQLLSGNVVDEGKKALVAYLAELAKDTSNKVDDYMVSVIAEALGVPTP